MKNVFMYAHNPNSESAIMLSRELGIKRIAHRNSKFVPSEDKIIINWGSSKLPAGYEVCKVLNDPNTVGVFVDKIKAFQDMGRYCSVPPWTTDSDEAISWLCDGETVVERHVVNGHGGDGIVIVDPADDPDENMVDEAPLYTMYIKKKSEFRVHFADGQIIHVQRKVRAKDFPAERVDWRVRNMENGFVFAHNEGLGDIPKEVLLQASCFAKYSGLCFGALDIIYNENRNRAFVLEANTAPGLSPNSATLYRRAIAGIIKRMV